MNSVVNNIQLVGRVGSDPEVKYDFNDPLAKLSIAVRRPYSEDPDWFACEIWGKTAEVVANHVSKGTLIGVSGQLQIDSWMSPEGVQRFKPIIRVEHLDLLSSSNNNSDTESPSNTVPEPSAQGDF